MKRQLHPIRPSLGKVSEATGQAIDLVDAHHINLAGSNIGRQLLESRAL